MIAALEKKSALARSLLGDEATGKSVSQLTQQQMCDLLMGNHLPSEEALAQ